MPVLALQMVAIECLAQFPIKRRRPTINNQDNYQVIHLAVRAKNPKNYYLIKGHENVANECLHVDKLSQTPNLERAVWNKVEKSPAEPLSSALTLT